ncbi:MAG: DUF4145 domain-containing protein [Planctomycetota bacterium]|jgi:hypothetical protein
MGSMDKLNAAFEKLIKEGDDILQKNRWDGTNFYSNPSTLDYNKWYTSASNLIEKTCGSNNSYYRKIEALYVENRGQSYIMPGCLGILKALYEDLKLGLLEDTKALITAEVFTDFIEQAEYLLNEGYVLPAAVIARTVLEDALRTLCRKNDIDLSKKPKLEWMNVELTKKGVYNRNTQKQITAWAGIGNSAAHGKTEEFTEDDVNNMIKGIINFNATYLK